MFGSRDKRFSKDKRFANGTERHAQRKAERETRKAERYAARAERHAARADWWAQRRAPAVATNAVVPFTMMPAVPVQVVAPAATPLPESTGGPGPGWRASCSGRSGAPIPAGFSAVRYLQLNPDVAKAVRGVPNGAFKHYSCSGAREGRNFAGYNRPGFLGDYSSPWRRAD